MQLIINTREKEDITVLDLKGKIVAGEECDALRSKFKELLTTGRKKNIVNFAEVARIDSTGIGMLVEAVINTVRDDGQLKLFNLPRLIYNILSTHRLLQAFDIYRTEEEALASFAKSVQQPAAPL